MGSSKSAKNILRNNEMLAIGDYEINQFDQYLCGTGLSRSTIANYKAVAKNFAAFLNGNQVCTDSLAAFIEHVRSRCTISGANAIISGLNKLMDFLGCPDLRSHHINAVPDKVAAYSRELTLDDIPLLINTAKSIGNKRGELLLRTIFATGINVSQMVYITVEAAAMGKAEIPKKDRTHEVIIPDALCDMLCRYADEQGVTSGSVFLSKSGRPLHRMDIFREIKAIAEYSRIDCNINPSSLRKLFGRVHYSSFTSILETVDVLGNKSVTSGAVFVPAPSKDRYRENLNKLFMTAQGE